MTRRAMAVAGATLCAPIVAAVGLAAIAAAGGGDHPEMGYLAGTQGLRGTTVAATAPAPIGVLGPPTDASKAKAGASDEGTAPAHKRHPTQDTSSHPQRDPAPTTRVPAQKPPTHVPAQRPPSRVTPTPPPQSVDPSGPGAPTTSGNTGATSGGAPSGGGGGSDTSGSSSGSGTSGSSSGSSTTPGYPDYPDGQSGGD